MIIFGRKPKKCQFFDFLNLSFLQPRKAFYRSRISQTTFSWPIVFKEKVKKWPFFNQNPGLTLLEKSQFYPLFELFFFTALKGLYSFQNIVKAFSWPILTKGKSWQNWPFLDQNHKISRSEKCHFFGFLNFLSLKPRKWFFCSRLS